LGEIKKEKRKKATEERVSQFLIRLATTSRKREKKARLKRITEETRVSLDIRRVFQKGGATDYKKREDRTPKEAEQKTPGKVRLRQRSVAAARRREVTYRRGKKAPGYF